VGLFGHRMKALVRGIPPCARHTSGGLCQVLAVTWLVDLLIFQTSAWRGFSVCPSRLQGGAYRKAAPCLSFADEVLAGGPGARLLSAAPAGAESTKVAVVTPWGDLSNCKICIRTSYASMTLFGRLDLAVAAAAYPNSEDLKFLFQQDLFR
jgi:hypothetical protein